MRLMAWMVLVSAFFDSTCALVDSVINGYLFSSQRSVSSLLVSSRRNARQCHGEQASSGAGERVRNIVALLGSDCLGCGRAQGRVLHLLVRLGGHGERVRGRGCCDLVRHAGGGNGREGLGFESDYAIRSIDSRDIDTESSEVEERRG